MTRQFERPYLALLATAALWTALNCVYVYFAGGEGVAYRIESAALIFGSLAIPLLLLRRNEEARPRATPAGDRIAFALLALLWLAILGPLLSFPFLSDDYSFLASFTSLPAALRPFQFYRPLFGIVFAVLGRLGDRSPAVFHAAAFALHLASSWLVYRLAERLSRGPALVAAAVFLLNPVQLEAVLWAAGLQELLWTFFVLAALAVYVGRRELSAARMLAVMAFVAAGLGSKETACCVVLLLPLVELTTFGLQRVRAASIAVAVAAAECALYFVLRSRAVAIDEQFFVAPSHYFVKQMLVIPYEVFVHPWNRTAVSVPAIALCATALLAIGLAGVALWRGASRSALVGPALIVISVLPVYSLFYVAPDLAGSRYLYFGAAGFGLLAAELCGRISSTTRAIAVASVALAFSVSLVFNLRPWRAAADLVDAIQEAVVAGESPRPSIETWESTHAPGLVLKDGIPESYQGVWVFRNGYSDFVARLRR